MTSFVLGGGCFWCLDSSFMQFIGVEDVVVGYMGGANDNPTYEQVCEGNTGHAEVAEIIFDESVISAETILEIFFTIKCSSFSSLKEIRNTGAYSINKYGLVNGNVYKSL